jgi:hypothetical protein
MALGVKRFRMRRYSVCGAVSLERQQRLLTQLEVAGR